MISFQKNLVMFASISLVATTFTLTGASKSPDRECLDNIRRSTRATRAHHSCKCQGCMQLDASDLGSKLVNDGQYFEEFSPSKKYRGDDRQRLSASIRIQLKKFERKYGTYPRFWDMVDRFVKGMPLEESLAHKVLSKKGGISRQYSLPTTIETPANFEKSYGNQTIPADGSPAAGTNHPLQSVIRVKDNFQEYPGSKYHANTPVNINDRREFTNVPQKVIPEKYKYDGNAIAAVNACSSSPDDMIYEKNRKSKKSKEQYRQQFSSYNWNSNYRRRLAMQRLILGSTQNTSS